MILKYLKIQQFLKILQNKASRMVEFYRTTRDQHGVSFQLLGFYPEGKLKLATSKWLKFQYKIHSLSILEDQRKQGNYRYSKVKVKSRK